MAQSVACNHFPQVVWRNGHKHLWNPVHRQALKNRPEERVRLRIVEYLIHGGWSKHRISTEEAIDLPRREAKLRTDLICYTQEFVPLLLVECKAENINLSDQTAEQIARYNQQVSAPFLLMTNGRTDYWYEMKENKTVESVAEIPGKLPGCSSPQTDFNYWQKRGFAGAKAIPDLRLWLTDALKNSFINADKKLLRHLSFQKSPDGINLSHYYRISSIGNSHLATTFAATEFGGSRLIGILNREGKNEAVLEINLDLLFDDRTPNALVYWSGGTKNLDVRKGPSILRSEFDFEVITASIHKILIQLIK